MADDRKKKYEDKRVIKRVSFNTTTENQLLKFAESIDFSTWVKQKILMDLEQGELENGEFENNETNS